MAYFMSNRIYLFIHFLIELFISALIIINNYVVFFVLHSGTGGLLSPKAAGSKERSAIAFFYKG